MTVYRPILKGKAGEFEALQHASRSTLVNIEPVIELLPGADGRTDIDKFVNVMRRSIPGGLVIAIDAFHLAQEAPEALGDLAEQLHHSGIPVHPVVRIDDSLEMLSSAREICRVHREGLCLRVGSADCDPAADLIEDRLNHILKVLAVGAQGIDLLFDFWEVGAQRDLDRVIPTATKVVQWSRTRPWRSVTLAAGAFPSSLTKLPRDGESLLPRFDAMLWKEVKREVADLEIGFGDYAIAHPAPPAGPAQAPTPNLRYTVGRSWLVYRQATPRELGNERFYDLCTKVISSSDWPGAEYSWGDDQISRCSSRLIGPGNATKWRAYGTSHHLATVTDRLANLGEP